MSEEIAAPHESAIWRLIWGMRNGPVDQRMALNQIEASYGARYGVPIEIVALWDGPVTITIMRPNGIEDRPITESECEAIVAALNEAGFGAEQQADKDRCVEAFAAWHRENGDELIKSGAYCNTQSILLMGFQAGWAAHKAADVWE